MSLVPGAFGPVKSSRAAGNADGTSGNEVGPFKAIEESTISHLTPSSERSSILAWYVMAGLAGTASGTLIFGWVVQHLQDKYSWSPPESYRVVFWTYAALGLVKFFLALVLGSRCEPDLKPPTQVEDQADAVIDETSPLLHNGQEADSPKSVQSPSTGCLFPRLSDETRSVILKLCFLLALDSLASGLAPWSWMTYYFSHKFGLTEGRLGSLFFSASILSSLSNLLAPWLVRRLGLIKTMVFTHVPASLALAAIPIPNSAALAMTLLLFRASTNSMDQAPRQAFLAAAVQPSERTAVMGLVNVVKTLTQSLGPVVTGILANRHMFGLAFIIAGALKIMYDILMLAMFFGYRTVEERAEENVEARLDSDERSFDEEINSSPSTSTAERQNGHQRTK